MQHNGKDLIPRGHKQHKVQHCHVFNSLLRSLKSQAVVTRKNTAGAKFEGGTMQRKSHNNPEILQSSITKVDRDHVLVFKGGKFWKYTLSDCTKLPITNLLKS